MHIIFLQKGLANLLQEESKCLTAKQTKMEEDKYKYIMRLTNERKRIFTRNFGGQLMPG